MPDASPTPSRTPVERPGARLRRTRTREALLTAARDLMAQGSRAPFTVDEVVQAAGVAKGSFYNHFSDKDAIADAVRRAVREREEAEVRTLNRDVADPVARIARAMALYARLAITTPEDARILTLDRLGGRFLRSSVNAGLVSDLSGALRDGRIVAPSMETAAMLVLGQVAVLIARLGGDADAARSVTQACIALTLTGFGLAHRDAQLIATQSVDAVLATA